MSITAKEPPITEACLSCHIEPREDCPGKQGEHLPRFWISYRDHNGEISGKTEHVEIFLTKAQLLEMKL